jgi:hypothetical protein
LNRLLILLPLLLSASCATYAAKPTSGPEFEGGMIRVGGGLGLASNSPGLLDGKSSGGQLSAGYLFTGTLEAGVAGSIDSVDSDPENIDLSLFTVYGRAYGRDYGPIRPWFQVSLGTGTSETDAFQGDTNVIGLGIGFMHFLNENWSLDVSADQNFYHQVDGGADNSGIRVGFGVSYWL